MTETFGENLNVDTMPVLKKSQKRPWIPERKPFGGRAVDNTKFYQSAAWRKLRAKVLMERPLCEECLKKGLVVPAQVVDHIVPIVKGGEPLNESNLQPLCHRCHNAKSANDK